MNPIKKSLLAFSLVATAFGAAPINAVASADPFLGETMLFGGNFCPRGWAKAEGQLLAISSYEALFSLYGTIYGGDGRTSFGLPDLRGRTPIGAGQGDGLTTRALGARVGTDQPFVLTVATMPAHNHKFRGYNQPADKAGPGGKYLAQPVQTPTGDGAANIYTTATPNRTMAADMLTSIGSGTPVRALRPVSALQWCVAMTGIYPSRN